MTRVNILNILLFSVPEVFAVVTLAAILAGAKFFVKRLLPIGIIVGFLSHFWRLLFNNYILNIIIYVLVLVILMNFYKIGSDLFVRVVSVMFSISIYLTVEFINLKIFDVVYGVDPIEMFAKPFLRYACFIGQIFIVFSISYLLKYFNLSLFNRGYHEEI